MRESPRALHRKIERTPLYLNSEIPSSSNCSQNGSIEGINNISCRTGGSHSTLDHSEILDNTACDSTTNSCNKRPSAMGRPQRSRNWSGSATGGSSAGLPNHNEVDAGETDEDDPVHSLNNDRTSATTSVPIVDPKLASVATTLRESRSLDPFPQLRKRFEAIKGSSEKFLKNHKHSRSLDDGDVALISTDPNATGEDIDGGYPRGGDGLVISRIGDMIDSCNQVTNHSRSSSIKHLNNNCNGSINIEDSQQPLLRQGSLTTPTDEINWQSKRWHSLETMGGVGMRNNGGNAGDNNSNSKKAAMGRGSIATWLVNIFHGNTIRPSDTSSTRVGIMQSGVRGMAGFGEIPSAPERESIV